MVNVLNVAKYILSRLGPMSAMKLQKLVYYSQAWSLVWDERRSSVTGSRLGPTAPFLRGCMPLIAATLK